MLTDDSPKKIEETVEQMSSSALDSPSSLDEPLSDFTDSVIQKIKEPSRFSTIPDHSEKFDEEYQVYLKVMRELVNWDKKISAYEEGFEKMDAKHIDHLRFTYQEILVPFAHQMKILIRNNQEEVADEIQGILNDE
jgi:hypothetical protein